ncbi:MAG: hypothetical protein ACFFEY_10430 [Candidatus Thorarchaeota archaeon]
MDKNKKKVIDIGFQNESIQSCVDTNEIFKLLEEPNIKENLDKCLKSGSKLFTH